MSVYSMTAYASVQRSARPTAGADAPNTPLTNLVFGLEIRSVNSRFLDLTFRLPDELRHCEPRLRELLSAKLKRGKVEVRVTAQNNQAASLQEPGAALLTQLVQLQKVVQTALPEARPLSVSDVLKLANNEDIPLQEHAGAVVDMAQEAVTALLEARSREGAKLATGLLERINQLRTLAQQATPLIPQLVEQQRQLFLKRWNDALSHGEGSAAIETAQERALTEATAFAIRIDVAEELTRLVCHLDEIERLLKPQSGQRIELGKRLDFLIQELHREANTLSAKSAALELTRISVDMRVLIEQMREQVQNIE